MIKSAFKATPDNAPGIQGRWSMRKRDIGTTLWVAFLAACVGTFVIFGVMDPDALNDAWVLPWEMGRKLAYSLGFLFLFIVSLIASSLTVFMIRTGPGEDNPDLDAGD